MGALGGLLGGSWELLRASGLTKEGLQNRLGTLLGLVCPRLAAEDGLGSVVGRLWLVRSLLGSILSSQTDPPTLTNVDFMKAGARFLKNHYFRFKDGFGSVLGFSRRP